MGLGVRSASDVSTEGLRTAAESALRNGELAASGCAAADGGPCGAAPDGALLVSRATLRFKHPALEAAFAREWSATRADTHDRAAATSYLAMVLGGAALLLAGRARFDPGMGAGCDWLVLWSALVPGSHVLLMAAAPRNWYRKHRTAVILAYRAAYLAFTSPPTWGLGGCVVGAYYAAAPGSAARDGETLFSALMWRSGLIATLWYAGAFPLLLRHHLPVQLASAAVYAARLSAAACADFGSVQGGAAAARWLEAAMGRAQEVFFAAHGVGGGGGGGGGSVPPPGQGLTCGRLVVFGLLALGVALPGFVVYATEARARAAWLRRVRASMAARQWAAAAAAAEAEEDDTAGCSSGAARPPPTLPPHQHQQQHQQQPEAVVAAAIAAASASEGPFDALAPPAVPRSPSCFDAYALATALVAAWLLVTEQLPLWRAASAALGALAGR
ncbi:hypothetical protein Rsub_12053 [Raphidocelis subcapitata]|uniref:Uncharacterized protein n=1 Tax=Raphidocelis subcapitata TaxID=307507 RepID=A0A2V0PMI1_9CHLO|nr:hypothetical protein Rsub_12053 [Raphidocelis subcapitata]|eukprot:GBF99293.1 hypothetical protein Rsub_12053 [Raphidocelis subcapitata]